MEAIQEPDMPARAGSEIEAAVDLSIAGLDSVFRPIFICQETEILQLTLKDAKRLRTFLDQAIKFVGEFSDRSLQ